MPVRDLRLDQVGIVGLVDQIARPILESQTDLDEQPGLMDFEQIARPRRIEVSVEAGGTRAETSTLSPPTAVVREARSVVVVTTRSVSAHDGVAAAAAIAIAPMNIAIARNAARPRAPMLNRNIGDFLASSNYSSGLRLPRAKVAWR